MQQQDHSLVISTQFGKLRFGRQLLDVGCLGRDKLVKCDVVDVLGHSPAPQVGISGDWGWQRRVTSCSAVYAVLLQKPGLHSPHYARQNGKYWRIR